MSSPAQILIASVPAMPMNTVIKARPIDGEAKLYQNYARFCEARNLPKLSYEQWRKQEGYWKLNCIG